MNPHQNSQSALVGDWSKVLKKSSSRLSKNTILGEYVLMSLLRIFSIFLLMGLTFSSQSFAELLAEESVDDKWVVDYITDNSVHATVNGQVTHGDRLHVRMVKGHCDKGNLITFVYTYSNHPEIEQLRDQYVMTNFMGGEVIVNVLFASPFLMGHRATLDIGWADIEELKVILSQENPITMEYKDSSEIKITDYFDITENSWSNDGLIEALDRASVKCNEL